jgi:hypothetical protein
MYPPTETQRQRFAALQRRADSAIATAVRLGAR